MAHDLVIFVPGILGSILRAPDGDTGGNGGKDVWRLTFGVAGSVLLGTERYFDRIALPDGLGSAEPDGEHALRPAGLLVEPRTWPGLMPHVAYKRLARYFAAQHDQRIVVFPYDWRLSNRVSAQRLAEFTERELGRWREERRAAGAVEEPKAVFVCHSMGGLVARYYLEVLGGREIARSMVTIGTPYAGAVKAVQALTGTLPRRKVLNLPGRLREGLLRAARSMPSVHELLPTYQCVTDHPDGTRLDTVDVPGLDTDMVRRAFAFRSTLDEHVRKNAAADRAAGTGPAYRVFAAGGRGMPTDVSLSLSGGETRYRDRFEGDDRWQGDGTVWCLSAAPPEWPDTAHMDWYPRGHTALANDELLHGQLRDRFDALDVRPYQSSGVSFGIEVPEVVRAGEPFVIEAVSEHDGLLLEAALIAPDGTPTDAAWRLLPTAEGVFRATAVVPPGLWTLEISAPRVPAAPVQEETLLALD
ncbi:esterase/lipase family protein [Streptomyces sp. NPDC056178]|uniref:esterase/lipase family protein n=1 Tax=unclassified Streptomyces TaxID=2593676 RepID=UPI0035E0DDB0